MSLRELQSVLSGIGARVVACSGGVDSLVLATVAHRELPRSTLVAHAVTPAVPAAATVRVHTAASREGWPLEIVHSDEFADERYLANPVDRCYHCKSHLYDALGVLADQRSTADATLLSGANLDDLGEYRPGLDAAAERGVRHPFVEAGIDKAGIRSIARELRLDVAELPASPCLASRLYTGTRVTVARLRAVEMGEELIRTQTGIGVVRCRVREDQVVVEVDGDARAALDDDLLDATFELMRLSEPGLASIRLDDRPYRPGRAVLRSI